MIPLLYNLYMFLCCGFIALYGGQPGRVFAIGYITASVLSAEVTVIEGAWEATNWPLLAIDFAFLVFLYGLAIRVNRYWPIWAAGFQLVTVITHFGAMLTPDINPYIYRGLASVWSLFLLSFPVIGIYRDRKRIM